MRVALIADIHANQPALEAVLADLPPVDSVVCLGDIVGYNPMPEACLKLVQEHVDVIVQGNHDRLIETPIRMTGNRMARAGLGYAKEVLSTEQREWLQSLPQQAMIDDTYLAVHSHPTRTESYVYPDAVETLDGSVDEYTGVVLAHTHLPDISTVNDTLIVNPGSVGQPRDENPKASYAILDTDSGDATLHRTGYNVDKVYHEVIVEGLPSETGKRLFDGT